MPSSPPRPGHSTHDTTHTGWTDPETGTSLSEAMTLHVDDPGFIALERERDDAHDPVPECHPSDGLPGYPPGEERYRAILRIARRAASRPVLDDRSPDEILGYDEHGLPT